MMSFSGGGSGASVSQPPSSVPTRSVTGSETPSTPFSPTEWEVAGLRGEVANLRHQMEEMRAHRVYEAPPEYMEG